MTHTIENQVKFNETVELAKKVMNNSGWAEFVTIWELPAHKYRGKFVPASYNFNFFDKPIGYVIKGDKWKVVQIIKK